MFRGLNLTKHCNAQQIQLFGASKLTELEYGSVSWLEPHKTTAMLKKTTFHSFKTHKT